MFIKLDLDYGDRVFVKGVCDDINGEEVVVTGVAMRGVIDNYIVEFVDGKTRMSFENYGQKSVEYKSLVLPEVCLTRVSDSNGLEITSFMDDLKKI